QVTQLIAPPPAAVTSATPSSIARGQSNVSVTINGTSSSGSGFYDPGVGFEKRLTAQITGGVVINAITSVTATSVTLSLNTIFADSIETTNLLVDCDTEIIGTLVIDNACFHSSNTRAVNCNSGALVVKGDASIQGNLNVCGTGNFNTIFLMGSITGPGASGIG